MNVEINYLTTLLTNGVNKSADELKTSKDDSIAKQKEIEMLLDLFEKQKLKNDEISNLLDVLQKGKHSVSGSYDSASLKKEIDQIIIP